MEQADSVANVTSLLSQLVMKGSVPSDFDAPTLMSHVLALQTLQEGRRLLQGLTESSHSSQPGVKEMAPFALDFHSRVAIQRVNCFPAPELVGMQRKVALTVQTAAGKPKQWRVLFETENADSNSSIFIFLSDEEDAEKDDGWQTLVKRPSYHFDVAEINEDLAQRFKASLNMQALSNSHLAAFLVVAACGAGDNLYGCLMALEYNTNLMYTSIFIPYNRSGNGGAKSPGTFWWEKRGVDSRGTYCEKCAHVLLLGGCRNPKCLGSEGDAFLKTAMKTHGGMTKQTCRESTGGKAPRKSVAGQEVSKGPDASGFEFGGNQGGFGFGDGNNDEKDKDDEGEDGEKRPKYSF
jgi:hypothetical protein